MNPRPSGVGKGTCLWSVKGNNFLWRTWKRLSIYYCLWHYYCCGLLSSPEQMEKQEAKVRNGSISLRRAQVLPQLKDVNPGTAGFLSASEFLSIWKQSQEPGTKSHHSATPWLCNVPTPNKKMTKQFETLLEPLTSSEVAGGYCPGIGVVSAGINHSSPPSEALLPCTLLSLGGMDYFKHKQFIFASWCLFRGIPQ